MSGRIAVAARWRSVVRGSQIRGRPEALISAQAEDRRELRTRRVCLSLLAVALVLSGGGASRASHVSSNAWVMTDLGVLPGGYRSDALAVNGRGQVVGTSNVADRTRHVFLWQNGTMIDLGAAPGVIGINKRGQVVIPAWRHAVMWDKGVSRRLPLMARAFNDAGQVAGVIRLSNGGHHAALWSKGRLRDLGTLGGLQSEAVAINHRGLIVGTSETTSGASHGFLWRNGKIIDLGTLGGQASEVWSGVTDGTTINERGQIVGVSQTKTGTWHAFLWQNGTMADLGIGVPELGLDTIYAINERGQVLVSTDKSSVLWNKGKTTRLGTLGGNCTQPEGFNDLGDIVGASCVPPAKPTLQGTPHAFIWEGGVITDLGRSARGPNSSRAYAVNNQRQIVGATETGEIVKPGTSTQTAVQHAVLWTRSSGG